MVSQGGVCPSLQPRTSGHRVSLVRAGRARASRPGQRQGCHPARGERTRACAGFNVTGLHLLPGQGNKAKVTETRSGQGRKEQKRVVTSKDALEIALRVRIAACCTSVLLQLKKSTRARTTRPRSTDFSRPSSRRPLFAQATLLKSMEMLL